MWVYSPPKAPKPKVPETIKAEVEAKANELVESVLKPRCVKPKPKGVRLNYIVDVYTKWYRSYFYFCAKYACPGPHAISPFFEAKYARMEYVGNGRFNLSYMRHTGEWIELETDLSVDKCLEKVKDDPYYFTC